MKTILSVSLMMMMMVVMTSFTPSTRFMQQANPQLTFEQQVYDFGTVYTDDLPDTKVDIHFTNTGGGPLLISGVRACCGTRVLEWPREPVLPGDSGTVKVNFRLSPNPQSISRTVTITYNHPDTPSTVFRIIGRVVSR